MSDLDNKTNDCDVRGLQLYSKCLPLSTAVTKRLFMAVWQEEVNSGRADMISIMYFALFILEQLQEEVDTMMSGRPEQWWVGELLAHTNTNTHASTTQSNYCMAVDSQCLQVHETSEAIVSNLLYSVVVKMPEEKIV